jgi:outer membrane protein assembly factor BamB
MLDRNDIHVTVVAVLAIMIMLLLTQLQMVDLTNMGVTGAVILKDRCETTPESMVVFGSNDNHVYGLDAKTGCIVWRFDDAASDFRTPARVVDGIVFLGTTDNTLYALSWGDGTQQWSSSLSGDMYGGAAIGTGVMEGYIFVADASGDVAAISISSGTAAWTYELHFSEQDVSYEDTYDELGEIDGGRVYAVEEFMHAGHVAVIDAASGSLICKYTANSMIFAAPAVGTDMLYVTTGENKLYRIHKDYCVAQSYFQIEKSIKSSPVIDVAEDGTETIFFGADDGILYAVEVKSDGSMEQKWKYYIGFTEVTAPATIGDELVYFSAYDKKVYALDKETGTLVWTYTTEKKNYAGPTLYDGMLYIPSGDYFLHAVDAETGTLVWTYETDGIIYGEAAVGLTEEVAVIIDEDAGSDDAFTGDSDETQVEILALMDKLEDLEDTIDALYDTLDDAGGDSDIEWAIDDFVEAYDASLDSFDTEVDALLSANAAIETDDDNSAVSSDKEDLEADIDATVASYEDQIEAIEFDIGCIDSDDDDCDE